MAWRIWDRMKKKVEPKKNKKINKTQNDEKFGKKV